MATDTARVQLELASGRNEVTAPFHQTAQRRRTLRQEPDAESVDAPDDQFVDAPVQGAATSVAPAVPAPEFAGERPGVARPPWLAFGAALLAVGFGVWWVMSQRVPAIDPAVVIERNLNHAEAAMADGRYSDPPERSAFHYYNTVLALDPTNADAIAGIDAIADRHLTNARVLLAQKHIAEAGVALEKARRVRPDHNGLAVLDAQWRVQLRKMLARSAVVSKPPVDSAAQPATSKKSGSAPDIKQETVAGPAVTDEAIGAAAALMAAKAPAQAETTPAPAAVTPDTGITADNTSAAGSSPTFAATANNAGPDPVSSIGAAAGNVGAVAPVPDAAAPKLVKMVQPQYPQEALMRGIEGWVEVSLQVSANGDVIDPRVEESSRGRLFNRAALTAVEQWKYQPRSDGASSERIHVRLQFRQSN